MVPTHSAPPPPQVFEPYMGLKRGRLIGASAVPVIGSQNVSDTPKPGTELPHLMPAQVYAPKPGTELPHLMPAQVYAPKPGTELPHGFTSLPKSLPGSVQSGLASFSLKVSQAG